MNRFLLHLTIITSPLILMSCDNKKSQKPTRIILGSNIPRSISSSEKDVVDPKKTNAETFRPKDMPCRIIRKSIASYQEIWDLKYDKSGRLTHSIRTSTVAPSPPPEKKVYLYDKDNRLVKYDTTEITYNSNGTIKSTIKDGEKVIYRTNKAKHVIKGEGVTFGMRYIVTYKPYRSKTNLPIPFGYGNNLFFGEEKTYLKFKGKPNELVSTVEYQDQNRVVSSITNDFGTFIFKYKCEQEERGL